MYDAQAPSGMDHESEVRLHLLKQHCVRLKLVRSDGVTPSPSKLAAKIGRSANQCSGILRGTTPFGEDLARDIEEKLHLGKWALDGAADWPFPGIDRERFNALTHDQRIEIQGVVRDRIEAFEAYLAAASRKRSGT